jgi:lactate permease
MAGRKGHLRGLAGRTHRRASFGVVQFLVSNFIGPELVDILASLASIGSLLLLLRFWRPRSVWRFEREGPHVSVHTRQEAAGLDAVGDTRPDRLPLGTAADQGLPERHLQRQRQRPRPRHGDRQGIPPVVAKPSPTAAVFAWNPLSATGTALLVTTAANSSSGVMAKMIDAQSSSWAGPRPGSWACWCSSSPTCSPG